MSDVNSESANSAQFIDYFLNPLSQTHDSYLKDSYDFVHKIQKLKFSSQAFLFTIDVESLYTNTDTALGIQAVRHTFRTHPAPRRPDEAILELLYINLTRNYFIFNSQHFLQIHGTAMGKKFAPAYAYIYMANWENTLFPKLSHRPSVYFRFLDDIFGVFEHGHQSFEEFLERANEHHISINLKACIDPYQVNFLDLTVFFPNSSDGSKILKTKVFFKPTDTHCLLHKTLNTPLKVL